MNTLFLGGMLISYAVCIYFVISGCYSIGGTSLSSVITHPNYQTSIFGAMLAMGIFTILYEWAREDVVSFFAMMFLLGGVYGVVLIDESQNIHYYFGTIVLLSIFTFMFRQSFLYYDTKFGSLLFFLFSINYLIMIPIIYNAILNVNILFFLSEVIYVGCFGIFYLLLHAIKH